MMGAKAAALMGGTALLGKYLGKKYEERRQNS